MQDSVCLQGLPFAQCFTFSVHDNMGDALAEGGSYTLVLGDGTELASHSSGENFSDCDEEGSYDCGENNVLTFCIADDGSDDSVVYAAGDNDDDNDDDDDDGGSRSRRASKAKKECPVTKNNVDPADNKNTLVKTKNPNCGWMRRTKKPNLKRNRYTYACMNECKDSTERFTYVTGKKKKSKTTKCGKMFGSLTGTKLKRTCMKKIDAGDDCGSKLRVHDYCPLACSDAGKGMCADK